MRGAGLPSAPHPQPRAGKQPQPGSGVDGGVDGEVGARYLAGNDDDLRRPLHVAFFNEDEVGEAQLLLRCWLGRHDLGDPHRRCLRIDHPAVVGMLPCGDIVESDENERLTKSGECPGTTSRRRCRQRGFVGDLPR